MKKIAIIPARSGSKGVKNKNILPICGKPMLAYTIEAAVQSGLFERVILSTDSEEYGRIGEEYGAEVYYRGDELSNDTAPTFVVIEDLFKKIELDFDYFMLLQATSPLRNATHVKEACELFEARIDEFDFLVSMQPAQHPAVLVKPIEDDGSLKHFDTDFSNFKRQKFRDYSPNGAMYIAKPKEYLEHKHFYGAKSLAYIMSREDSADVDDKIDFTLVSLLMEKRLEQKSTEITEEK